MVTDSICLLEFFAHGLIGGWCMPQCLATLVSFAFISSKVQDFSSHVDMSSTAIQEGREKGVGVRILEVCFYSPWVKRR